MRVLPLRLHALSKCRPALGSLRQLWWCCSAAAPKCSIGEQRAGRCRRQSDESHAGSAAFGRHRRPELLHLEYSRLGK